MTLNLEPKPRRQDRSRRARDWDKVLEGFESGVLVIQGARIDQCEPYIQAVQRLLKSARKRAGGKT